MLDEDKVCHEVDEEVFVQLDEAEQLAVELVEDKLGALDGGFFQGGPEAPVI